ncbi:hypothetical protein [Staphylococcus felis]|uniref:hypothetical protein n=1 Tax=Staphylococcus felis TaxID=46127 RepID=UPI001F4DCB87|nr:hypothetical protein [Staphylococcus felis]
MLNMEIQTVNKLINSNIDATTIEKNTGVDASSIRRIRRGERTVEKLSFEKGIALYNYQKGLEVMYKAIEVKDQNNIVLIDSLGQFFTDIENDGNNHFNVDYALLNEVKHDNGKTYYEVEIFRTEEVPFDEEVTEDNIGALESKWIKVDQSGDNYIESIFFENEEDAKSYINFVLKGYKTFKEAAKAIGVTV